MTASVYLDYNATMPMRPQVASLMQQLQQQPLNASAVHALGREGRRLVEVARAQVAALVGAPVAQVIFNSGATEANNTVLKYFSGKRVLVSAIEHVSVLDVLPQAERIPVTASGIIDLAALEKMMMQGPRPALVSVMLVNNETGIIQPVSQISRIVKNAGSLFHCDAVQAAGRIPIRLSDLGADFLTLSSHKIGGPQGAGALVTGICGITPVLLEGGGQEKKARAGTENIAGIAGFGVAAVTALQSLDAESKRLDGLRGNLEERLMKISPEIEIVGRSMPRVANTTLIRIPGANAQSLLMAFDLEGIALSNGAACTCGSVKPSHVLKAMGADDADTTNALRISMGWNTTEADIDTFIKAWTKIHQRIGKKRTAAH